MLYWIGQAIGVIAMIESFFIYQASDRKKMVALKLLDDVLWVTHFVIIGGYNAAMTTGVAIFRELIFYHKADKKWANTLLWPIAFSVIFAACSIPGWKGVSSLLPSAASIASTWVFWINNEKLAKLIQLPSAGCMLVYDIACRSYSGTLTQFVTLASIAIYFLRCVKAKRARKSPEAIAHTEQAPQSEAETEQTK